MNNIFELLTINVLRETDKEVAELIGFDNFKKLVKEFGGDKLYLTSYRMLWQRFGKTFAIANFNGMNLQQIQNRLHLSRRELMKLLKIKRYDTDMPGLEDIPLNAILEYINPEALPYEQQRLLEMLGNETFGKLIEVFGDEKIYITNEIGLCRKYLVNIIAEKYDGTNKKKLIEEFGFNKSSVRKAVAMVKNNG